jgi:hypothetical protein
MPFGFRVAAALADHAAYARAQNFTREGVHAV